MDSDVRCMVRVLIYSFASALALDSISLVNINRMIGDYWSDLKLQS